MSEVTITVSGQVGCAKSAILGEIEIMLKAMGVPVRYADEKTAQAEKNGTHADWTDAIEMYKPSVVLVEAIATQPKAAPVAEAPTGWVLRKEVPRVDVDEPEHERIIEIAAQCGFAYDGHGDWCADSNELIAFGKAVRAAPATEQAKAEQILTAQTDEQAYAASKFYHLMTFEWFKELLAECRARAAPDRFFMDHGLWHDRVTGQHMYTQDQYDEESRACIAQGRGDAQIAAAQASPAKPDLAGLKIPSTSELRNAIERDPSIKYVRVSDVEALLAAITSPAPHATLTAEDIGKIAVRLINEKDEDADEEFVKGRLCGIGQLHAELLQWIERAAITKDTP